MVPPWRRPSSDHRPPLKLRAPKLQQLPGKKLQNTVKRVKQHAYKNSSSKHGARVGTLFGAAVSLEHIKPCNSICTVASSVVAFVCFWSLPIYKEDQEEVDTCCALKFVNLVLISESDFPAATWINQKGGVEISPLF